VTKSGLEREAAARRLLAGLRRRAALHNGIGILRVRNVCSQQQAHDDLAAEHGRSGPDGEARRMIADVDAAADGRADPDAGWD
jgi:hypothetical protein